VVKICRQGDRSVFSVGERSTECQFALKVKVPGWGRGDKSQSKRGRGEGGAGTYIAAGGGKVRKMSEK